MPAIKLEKLNVFSSEQWFSAIDYCIKDAIENLIHSTTLVEYYVSQLINYQLLHKKRNISSKYAWRDNISKSIKFCSNPTISRFMDLNINRDYVYHMLNDFEKITSNYKNVVYESFKYKSDRINKYNSILDAYHKRVGYHGNNDLLFVINHVSLLKNEYLNIRDLLIKNYKDYAINAAINDHSGLVKYTSIEDMKQNYILPIIKSINRYDVNKGSFKSYLDIWLRKYKDDPTNFVGVSPLSVSGVKYDDFISFDKDMEEENISINNKNLFDDIVNEKQKKDIVYQLALLVDKDQYAIDYLDLGG